jgi:hypothetical protein
MSMIQVCTVTILAVLAACERPADGVDLREGESYRGSLALEVRRKGQAERNEEQKVFHLDILSPNAKGEVVAEITIDEGIGGVVKSNGPPQRGEALLLRGEIRERVPVEMKITCDDKGLSGSIHLEHPNIFCPGTIIVEEGSLVATRVPTIVGSWKAVQNGDEIVQFRADRFVKIRKDEKAEGTLGIYTLEHYTYAGNDWGMTVNLKLNTDQGPVSSFAHVVLLSEGLLILDGKQKLVVLKRMVGDKVPVAHGVSSYKQNIIYNWTNMVTVKGTEREPRGAASFREDGTILVDGGLLDDMLGQRGREPLEKTAGLYNVRGDDLAITITTQRDPERGPLTFHLTIVAMEDNEMVLIKYEGFRGLRKMYRLHQSKAAQ